MKEYSPHVVSRGEFKFTKLVDHEQKYHEKISLYDAFNMAKNTGLDVVCFKEPLGNDLPFCKIIDFGKWQYNEKKRHKKQEKEHRISIKEIRFTVNIGEHDLDHKIKQASEFLDKGDEVIFSMRLKGRQRHYFDNAKSKMDSIIGMCPDAVVLSRKDNDSNIVVRIKKQK